MKALAAITCVVLTACSGFAAEPAKSKIRLAEDGFPTGHETPEGAACDLARAYINRDTSLFTKTCVRLYAGGKGPEDYAKFLKSTIADMKKEASRKEPSPAGPKSIGKAFAARHLSRPGPAAYGYATFEFQDIMFVDVGVFLHNEGHTLVRTLVIKDRDGKWYAHPLPNAGSGQLSEGLKEERASQKDFSEAYNVQN